MFRENHRQEESFLRGTTDKSQSPKALLIGFLRVLNVGMYLAQILTLLATNHTT